MATTTVQSGVVVSQRRQGGEIKWLVPVLVLLFLVLQFKLWVGEGSLMEVKQLRETISGQQLENEQMRQRNAALRAEVVDLKEGLAAVEERARSELGMIRKGETFFQIVETDAMQND